MSETEKRYPDISEILARKAEGRRERAALTFAQKLDAVDAMKERLAPIKEARERRRSRNTDAPRSA